MAVWARERQRQLEDSDYDSLSIEDREDVMQVATHTFEELLSGLVVLQSKMTKLTLKIFANIIENAKKEVAIWDEDSFVAVYKKFDELDSHSRSEQEPLLWPESFDVYDFLCNRPNLTFGADLEQLHDSQANLVCSFIGFVIIFPVFIIVLFMFGYLFFVLFYY
jgi:hypothetical protein